MRDLQLWSILTAFLVAFTTARPMPANSPGGSGVDRISLPQHSNNVGRRGFPVTAQRVVPKVEPGTITDRGTTSVAPATSEPFLFPLPAVRTDVVHSMLSDKFLLDSNEPVKQILGPQERKALHELGHRLFESPGVTWSHSFVDEPQVDLTYKKHLFIAAPIFEPGWQTAVGWRTTPETEHWLPIFFYRAYWDATENVHFNLAGIEVIKNWDEVVRLHMGWEERDTLRTLLQRFGRSFAHV